MEANERIVDQSPDRILIDVRFLIQELHDWDLVCALFQCLIAADRLLSALDLCVMKDQEESQTQAVRNQLALFAWGASEVQETVSAIETLKRHGLGDRLSAAKPQWQALVELGERWSKGPFEAFRNKVGFHRDPGLIRTFLQHRARSEDMELVLLEASSIADRHTRFPAAEEALWWGFKNEQNVEIREFIDQVHHDQFMFRRNIQNVLLDLAGQAQGS